MPLLLEKRKRKKDAYDGIRNSRRTHEPCSEGRTVGERGRTVTKLRCCVQRGQGKDGGTQFDSVYILMAISRDK